MIAKGLSLARRFLEKRGRLVFSAIVVILGVGVFTELAEDAPAGEYLEYERRVMLAMRGSEDPARLIGPGWVAVSARDITALGGTAVLVLTTVLALGYLLLKRKPRSALFLLFAVVGGTLLSSGLKYWFGRERPDFIPHLTEVTTSSFPSGHSMMSSVVYITLGALLSRVVASRREKVYFIAVALLLSFLIGLTRVFLGVHYPTDVIAGWAAGTAWAVLCWDTSRFLQRFGILRAPAPAAEAVAGENE